MNLRWRLNRLRAMGLAEMVYRTRQTGQTLMEKHGIGLAKMPVISGTPGKAWLQELPRDLDARLYREAADRILSGRFRIFAITDASLGFPPQWNQDARTGTRAPVTFGKTLDYRDERIVGDIKYLWEPNRHLELVTLAQAWHLSRDHRYAEGCRTLLDSWMQQCPYPFGPSWTSSLELGIRLINWSFAWHLLGGEQAPIFAGSAGTAFANRWLECIYRHCHFISGHKSLYSSANNHLLGELLGLFVGATTWPLWPQSARWMDQAQRDFESQALLQNCSDGVNKEQGIWYHHEVADMMLLAGLIGRANDRDFSVSYWRRWEAMLEFIASIMDMSGNVPRFGDADDAVIVRLSSESQFCAYRSLLAAGALLLNRSEFKIKAERLDDKTKWLLGDRALALFESLPVRSKSLPIRRSFAEGGYYILGSDFETKHEVRVVADVGPLGYLSIAAHGHADALSFVLSIGGREILVDPGTYTYHTNKKWRNYFRGTSAHNTVRVDGEDQSVPGGNFLWVRHAEAHCESFQTGDEDDRLRAKHDGYTRFVDPVIHHREIVYRRVDRVLEVCDTLECEAEHEVEIFWHFSDDCIVEMHDHEAQIRSGAVRVALRGPADLAPRLAMADEEAPLGWISRSFDSKRPSCTMVWSGRIRRTWRGMTLLRIAHMHE